MNAVTPYAQYAVSVSAHFIEPRKRRRASVRMVPDDTTYLTIETDGRVLYDSRAGVPCDMGAWAETNQRCARVIASAETSAGRPTGEEAARVRRYAAQFSVPEAAVWEILKAAGLIGLDEKR